MKKVIFALAAVVALAACSKEETLVQQAPEAIGFDTFVDNATRSVNDPSLTTNGLMDSGDGFSVYGFVTGDDSAPIFTDEQVKFAGGAWGYTNTQYWIEDVTYDFCAIAPYHVGWTTANATKSGASLTFTSDGETDLLYAQNNDVHKPTGNDKSVHFTFRHTLSKVKFSFLNNYDAANTTIKVHDIQVTNAYKTGKVTLNGSSTVWSELALATNNDFVLDFGEATDNEATAGKEDASIAYESGLTYESQNELLLIPADYTSTKLAVSFIYDIVVGDKTIKSITVTPAVPVNLEPGHAYDFKATISHGERIEFTVDEVSDWDYTDQDQTMQ